MLSTLTRTVAALGVLAWASSTAADDAFYRVRIDDLKITEGVQPGRPTRTDWRLRERAMLPYVVLDGAGEAYVNIGGGSFSPWAMPELRGGRDEIFVRTAQAGDVTGRLFYPKPDWSGMAILKFTIPAAAAKTEARGSFYGAKEAYYNRLMARAIPGGAWFRHEARQARTALNKRPRGNRFGPGARAPMARENELTRTYAIFSGGRAMSENLQLDRTLPGAKAERATIDIDAIPGISVLEINWKPLVKDLKPELDPLATSIPADQHVVFFPTFSAAVLTADEAERQGAPILHLAEPRSEDARTVERYQRQLCLSLSGLGRLLGPQMVKSVALTGSDPYFRTGTDVAVLFEAPNPTLLENLLLAQIKLASSTEPRAKPQQGEIDGLAYRGVRSPDRGICSYVAKLDRAVVVTNSLYQLGRLAEVARKKSPSIASLPEYVFFRDRYRRGDPEETALAFLSDATIRRWCGPRWRIATSRRTRDVAVLAELQAANLDRLVNKTIRPRPIHTDLATVDLGRLALDADGVHSSVQGSLEFITPIAELPLRKVTKAEAEAYRWWRNNYQRNWRWAFDPIALRLTLRPDRLAADLTVMPLILGSEYRTFIATSEGAKFSADAGDPHNALIHFILAVNTKSPTFTQASNFISTMARGVTLGWLGQSVAVYADDDPVWQELVKMPWKKLPESLPGMVGRLPIAVWAEVVDGFRLTAFLTGLRAYIEQTAPGMTAWESLSYKDQPYVKVSPSQRAKGQREELEKAAIYYAASGDALLVTLSEEVLKRAIDRQLARTAKEKDQQSLPPAGKPWLGSNVGLQVDRKAIEILGRLSRDEYQLAMQVRAWGNLPILNQWKRMYPDQDPVELHERVWRIRLICPGGGRYVWNEKYQTVESTVYGHPGEPNSGPAAPPALSEFSSGSFGLTFEHQGLRARMSLEENAKIVRPTKSLEVPMSGEN